MKSKIIVALVAVTNLLGGHAEVQSSEGQDLRTVNGRVYDAATSEDWVSVSIPAGSFLMQAETISFSGVVRPRTINLLFPKNQDPYNSRYTPGIMVTINHFPYSPTNFVKNIQNRIVTKTQLDLRLFPLSHPTTNWNALGEQHVTAARPVFDYGLPSNSQLSTSKPPATQPRQSKYASTLNNQQMLGQGPTWLAPKSPADQREQQRLLTEAYALQQAQQETQIISRQSEILKIYSKDPWRKINGVTNYVGDEGWKQFQGKVVAIESAGVLFQGSFGRILSVDVETDGNPEIITTEGETSTESALEKEKTRKSVSQKTYTAKKRYEKIYGDDYFMVVNFPYPAQVGDGLQKQMAHDGGYISYTNSQKRVMTVRKLDYGTPCIKIWSEKEIADAYKQAEERQAAVEVERAAQRELVNKQFELEKARIEADRIAKLAAIEAEQKDKQAAIEAEKARIQAEKMTKVESQKRLAENGDFFAAMRVGEFYRDGYGVEKDLAKAAKYFKIADELKAAEAAKLAEENIKKEQAEKQAKFLKNLSMADSGTVSSMIFVGKCYRDGYGVEQDLTKAREYLSKASSKGSMEAANLLNSLRQ